MPTANRRAAYLAAAVLLISVLFMRSHAGALETSRDQVELCNGAEATAECLLSDLERKMLTLVNTAREEQDLPVLAMSAELTWVAREHAMEMIDLGYFGHRSPTTGSPRDRVRQAGLSPVKIGENLAGHTSGPDAHEMLMNSPPHRANILDATYEIAGMAVVQGGPYGMMIVQVFASGLGRSTPPEDPAVDPGG